MTPSEPSATGGAIDDTYGLSGHSSGDETDIRRTFRRDGRIMVASMDATFFRLQKSIPKFSKKGVP